MKNSVNWVNPASCFISRLSQQFDVVFAILVHPSRRTWNSCMPVACRKGGGGVKWNGSPGQLTDLFVDMGIQWENYTIPVLLRFNNITSASWD